MRQVHTSPDEAARAVLAFWFDELGKEHWFVKNPAIDATIGKRFGQLRQAVLAGRAEAWRDTPETLLAAIILLDQFSRNIHRASYRAFEGDALAHELTMLALDRGWDKRMSPERRQFLLMPLMHSERAADQNRSLVEFGKLGSSELDHYTRLHHDQITRFGRFPGRNAALGRKSTEEEQATIEAGEVF